MAEVPKCPNCERPLQRGRETCMYCGTEIPQALRAEVDALLEDGEVKKMLDQAEFQFLTGSETRGLSPRARFIAKIIIIILCLAVATGLAWVADWNIIVVIVVAVFFGAPIWKLVKG